MAKVATPVRSTIEDVAESAGVSIATVSRVINKRGTVAPHTAKRVWEAIAKLDYVPHAAARGLASSKTHTIGMILSNTGNHFLSSLLKGVASCVTENGYTLLIYSTQRRFAKQGKGDPSLPAALHNTDAKSIRSACTVLAAKSPPSGCGKVL